LRDRDLDPGKAPHGYSRKSQGSRIASESPATSDENAVFDRRARARLGVTPFAAVVGGCSL